VQPLLALMWTVNTQLAYCETEITHVSARDPRVRRLRTAPSIGPVTAAAFVATLDKAKASIQMARTSPLAGFKSQALRWWCLQPAADDENRGVVLHVSKFTSPVAAA
jgi:hypothetical protein